MFMRKQMVLAVLVIPVAFGTETELQTGIVQLSPPAHRTPVLRPVGIVHMGRGLPFEFSLARSLLW